MFPTLLSPVTLLGQPLANRIAMAPMTRARARPDGVPGPWTALYYQQRASAGLIVSEGINISAQAVGSAFTPGLYTSEQVAAWKSVTAAVKNAGGRIVAQLWHTGRVGHSSLRGGQLPLAPSAIAIAGLQHYTPQGPVAYEVPRAMSLDEVKTTIGDYRRAAEAALLAGFDGVELHAAFGYLPHQFLSAGSNRRSDDYGGTIPNRCRFVLEVMGGLIDVWGAHRVGIKLSPSTPYNDIQDPDPVALYGHLIEQLNRLRPGYVHLMNPLFALDQRPGWPSQVFDVYGPLIRGSTVIANGGFSPQQAEDTIASGKAALVSFGTAFVANPDLPARLEMGWPLASPDRNTLYGGEEHGYTDYPRYAAR